MTDVEKSSLRWVICREGYEDERFLECPRRLEPNERLELVEAAPIEAELDGLHQRIKNAGQMVAAYQVATGTDYPGSLREHQREPDLIKAGRAYREQWGIQEALDMQREFGRLRKIEEAASAFVGAIEPPAASGGLPELETLRELLEER